MADALLDADRDLAAEAFNEVWTYLDKKARTDEETAAMLDACHASLWHWRRSPSGTPENLAIGLWQLSRAYAAAAMPRRALDYAERCVEAVDAGLPAWLRASAREALARALLGLGRLADSRAASAEAAGILGEETDAESRDLVEADLASLEPGQAGS